MYHVMICDDDRIFVDDITHMILACGLDKSNVRFYKYSSEKELRADIKNRDCCDMLILNMQIVEMDEHKTIQFLQERFPEAIFVFCSKSCQLTVTSFKVIPFYYLSKSSGEEQMKEKINLILRQMEVNKAEPYIIGTYFYNTVKVRPDDIMYLENSKRGSNIHICKDKVEYAVEVKLVSKLKLSEIKDILKGYEFEYAHNSYLVNLKYVEKMLSSGDLKLSDGTKLKVSRSKMKTFRERFIKYLQAGNG